MLRNKSMSTVSGLRRFLRSEIKFPDALNIRSDATDDPWPIRHLAAIGASDGYLALFNFHHKRGSPSIERVSSAL